jgi:spermidine synthase
MSKIVFSVAILISSFLLFLVQPMVGRMLLPSLGGTPSVWNTCVVFFQAVLLLGYGYAHFAAHRMNPRTHVLIHLGLLGIVCLMLPISLLHDWMVPTETNPLGWLLGQLVLCVGLPFFAISANAPLLQRWYSRVSPQDGADPYFLYATSNVGSLGALLVYPLLIEPAMGITAQTVLWLFGFLTLVLSFVACGYLVLNALAAQPISDGGSRITAAHDTTYRPLAWKTRLHFIALAAIPSSLMLGATTYITTDVGSFPLMWVLPLAVYLLTFILVFAKRQILPHQVVVRVVPFLLLLMPVVMLMDLGVSPLLMVTIHIGTFFFVSMLCHGEMARLRPPANQLTEFYLMMSVGGVLGGSLNALVAPVVFQDVFEYPLMLIAACFVLPRLTVKRETAATAPAARHFQGIDLAWPAGLLAFILIAHYALSSAGVDNKTLVGVAVFGVPALICFAASSRPVRFGLCYAVLTFACAANLVDRQTLTKARGFFGVNEVAQDPKSGFRTLINGRTMHGVQRSAELENPEPLSYFHRLGPMGDVFSLHPMPDDAYVGVVGLGIGSIASYGQPGHRFDFYEIDPVVYQLANNPDYFTYLTSCKAEHRVILGDARIQLARDENFTPPQPDQAQPRYDLLILDAFSSDSIPTHLITREAMQLYLSRLAPDGLIAMNVTNKFIDVRPVLLGLARHFDLTLAIREDRLAGDHTDNDGRLSVTFVVMSPKAALVEPFLQTERWHEVKTDRKTTLWTDEHSNIFDVLDWLPSSPVY